jgi:hypothetical protein
MNAVRRSSRTGRESKHPLIQPKEQLSEIETTIL